MIGLTSISKIKKPKSISIPFVDISHQHDSIKQELKTAIDKVINKSRFILGPKVQEFEQKVAEYCGARYAIGVASGTDALYLCLRGLGIGSGDEVITTPYTFFATAEAISLNGAIPVFVDIDETTFNINPTEMKTFLENRCRFSKASRYPINTITKREVKAVIPVHLFGQCADMKQILNIATKYNLKIIEDAAQSFGSSQLINGERKRAGGFGDAAILSFYPTKNFGALGDGGMVLTSDRELAGKVKILRVHAHYDENYHSDIGINSRLDEIQAATLLVKMKYLNQWNRERKKIWELYSKRLNKILTTPKILANNKSVFHQYVIKTRNRDTLKKYLAKNGIETKIYYPLPHHLQKCYKGLNYRKGDLPISERSARQALALPIYPGLSLEKVEYICETIRNFLQ